MLIQVVTLFPDMFHEVFNTSILKRAQDRGIVELRTVDLRRFGIGPHRSTDDYPFGGGVGMLLRADVVVPAVEWSMMGHAKPAKIVVTSAQGSHFSQAMAEEWATEEHLIIVAGHYEGIDQRAVTILNAQEVSIGDYIVTGGELPAMIMVDAVTRLQIGAIGAHSGAAEDSFSSACSGLLEGPQYTRPRTYRGISVPDVLMSGNHKRILGFQEESKVTVTQRRRPDILGHGVGNRD